jgi:nicotinic acid mononucleotide adenylyltransferase
MGGFCFILMALTIQEKSTWSTNINIKLWEFLMGAFSSYLSLLNEAKVADGAEKKTAVFTFGRFNPPTKGHERLINAVESYAKDMNGDPFVFMSQSHDKDKNPLSFSDKLVFMKRMFPNANFVENELIKNPFQAAGYLGSHLKYTDVVLVAGSDRAAEYQKRFSNPEKYFDLFRVVSAGERDPDSDGVSGMSGTRARMAAANNDLGSFYAATGWDGDFALQLMRAVQKGLKNG